jgi:hypothetical protein
MFEKFKANRALAKEKRIQTTALARAQKDLATWSADREQAQLLVDTALAQGTIPEGLMIHRGELSYATLANCSLIEERKGAGHYSGGSAGVSVPIGKIGGRSIRYRVGATRGHYVSGPSLPTAIATGTMYVTNQRIVFLSATQTRECRYDKLVGMTRDDAAGILTLSVSNRQHPIVIGYGKEVAPWADFHIDLGLAHYRGDIDQMVGQLQDRVKEIDAAKPVNPDPILPPSQVIPPTV